MFRHGRSALPRKPKAADDSQRGAWHVLSIVLVVKVLVGGDGGCAGDDNGDVVVGGKGDPDNNNEDPRYIYAYACL